LKAGGPNGLTIINSAMSYDDTIKEEAIFVTDLGSTATEDKFHALYSGILTTWFPTSKGYVKSWA